MGFNTDFVLDKLAEIDFEIIDMVSDPESGDMELRIKHDLHPDIEVTIKLVTSKNDDDVMEMEFIGPDDYTDDEAKKVLQDVMDFLVSTIERALEESPTPADGVESSDEGESSDGDN
jgi:hypothetical protein